MFNVILRRATCVFCLLAALGVFVQCESDPGGDPACETAADCLDAACEGVGGCEHGAEVSCDDVFDNDADGDTDCDDADCASEPICDPTVESDCDDGVDNDGDGDTDCDDADCVQDPVCGPNAETACDDGVDNDADGDADCLDTDCDGVDGCEHGTEASCGDGEDNDADGAADCLDSDCDDAPGCGSGGELICDDGVDNDGDGDVDCHDPDCGFTANEARITYYQGIDGGNCGFGTIPTTSIPYGYIIAPNTAFYNDAAVCGVFVELDACGATSWGGSTPGCSDETVITAMITDQCPAGSNQQWCSGDMHHFDLSEAAFDTLGELSCGVMGGLQWRFVERPGNDTLRVVNQAGSNAWWYSVFIHDHRYGIVSVEIRDAVSSTWVTTDRQTYNSWVATSTAGFTLPLSVRVTDIHGQVLTATDLVTDFNDSSSFDTGDQFPAGQGGGTLADFGL